MKGIYKITSPSGKVYIGQSNCIQKRLSNYKSVTPIKCQRILYHSLLKYGFENHVFEVIHELPEDVDQETMTRYEQLYLDQYLALGFTMLNSKLEAGARGRLSEESRKRIGEKHRGKTIPLDQRIRHSEMMRGRPSKTKGRKHTEEVKQRIKAKRALQKNVVGRPKGNIPWNKGKVGVQDMSYRKGKPLPEETKEKIRQKLLGSRLSPETIAKRTATLKKNGVKRKWSDEAKAKQSERLKAFNERKKQTAVWPS